MILARLEDAELYASIHSRFAEALAFLRENNLEKLTAGRCEIAGEDLFAMVVKGTGAGHSEAKLEAHREYIDIQYVLRGTDEMGWKSLGQCQIRQGDYDPEEDAELFSDRPSSWIKVAPGELAIFFPEDAHAPGAGEEEFHKIVVKVKV